jgi:hypothetical protein
MTVEQLCKRLQELVGDGAGNMTIVIQAMTGGTSGSGHAQVLGCIYGFDWDHGKILIQSDQTLLGAEYAEKRREAARKAGGRDAKRNTKAT